VPCLVLWTYSIALAGTRCSRNPIDVERAREVVVGTGAECVEMHIGDAKLVT
jgi:hypothetical protein